MQTHRSNAGALIGGAILIAFGFLSLAGQVFRNLDWGFFWPQCDRIWRPVLCSHVHRREANRRFCHSRQYYQRDRACDAVPKYHAPLGIHVLLLDADHHVRRRGHLHYGLVRR